MQILEQADIKFDQLQQIVSVMFNAEYKRFECAVINLLQDSSVFYEAEFMNLVTKTNLKQEQILA